ncbi:MAG: hypothetical protein QXK88_06945 [Desulfurococcaceae archaeon]
MNEKTGGNYLWLISSWWILSASLLIALFAITGRRKLGLFEITYLSCLLYVTTYWRVNYQYFTPLIGLAVLHVFSTEKPIDTRRPLFLIHMVLIALWVFMFPASWWAQVHLETLNVALIRLLNSITLGITQEEPYLAHSLALTALGYATLVLHLYPPGPSLDNGKRVQKVAFQQTGLLDGRGSLHLEAKPKMRPCGP